MPWHVALLFAACVALTGGLLGLVGGALGPGALFLLMRLWSGTAGIAALTHVGVNLFAFTELAARNWQTC